jgi:beta-glucosidase
MTLYFGRAIAAVSAASALLAGSLSAVAQSAPTADSIVNRMTPEQKIDYIGGTGFAIRAVPELGQ